MKAFYGLDYDENFRSLKNSCENINFCYEYLKFKITMKVLYFEA